jgi:molybdopterin-binding protein
MNKLTGVISTIDTHEGLSLVSLRVGADTFSSLVLHSPETDAFCRVGNEILLAFKETEVAVGKGLSGALSMRNRFPAEIMAIEAGQVLTSLTLLYHDIPIQSVITTRSAREMGLQVGNRVEGLVKTNEITLMAK